MSALRAFPYPLHIGTDICQISRVYRILAGPRRLRFLNRVLAPEELDRAGRGGPVGALLGGSAGRIDFGGPRDPSIWKASVFVAGRFAAKEAAFKAHPWRKLSFHDIHIDRMAGMQTEPSGDRPSTNGSGPPVAIIKGEDAAMADSVAMISISHDGDYATAVCLAAGGEAGTPMTRP